MSTLPNNWQSVRIDSVAEIARGGSPRPIKNFVTDDPDGVNWIRIGDTEKGGRYITGTQQKIVRDGIKRSRWVDEGDFLLSNSMSFGRPYILKTSGCIHDGWLVLKPNYARLDQDYFFYLLSAQITFQQFDSLAAGSTVRNLNIDLVSKVTIPLPPLEEQRRIVAKLDQAFTALDRARANAEANLADAEALYVATISQLFADRASWPCEDLNARVRFVDYRGKTPPKRENGIRLITAKNVRMGYIKEEPREFILESAYDEWMTRGFPEIGDVPFTTEAPLANVAELDTDEKVVIGQRPITMKTDRNEVVPRFLKWSLLSPQMQQDIREKGTGATVTGIKASLLKKIPFYVPPTLDDQNVIAAKCEDAFSLRDELTAQYDTKFTDLADLRQSLLQRAFSGQL